MASVYVDRCENPYWLPFSIRYTVTVFHPPCSLFLLLVVQIDPNYNTHYLTMQFPLAVAALLLAPAALADSPTSNVDVFKAGDVVYPG